MRLTSYQARQIVNVVAELAEIASAKDIDVAAQFLAQVARSLGIDPETVPTYNELAAL